MPAKNQKDYNADYYQRNKERIAEQRRQKYQEDAKLRNKARARARRRYHEQLKSPDRKVGYTVKKVNGVPLYTIQYAASITDRRPDFIRSWEKQGFIPKSTYTDSRGWRLYTEDQIKAMGFAFKKYDDGEWTKIQVRDYLSNHWN